MTDMGKFMGIGKIPNIPGQEKVAFMIGCQSQVESVTSRITGHHHTLNIGLDDLNDRRFNRDEGHCSQERYRLVLVGKCAILQFVEHGDTGHELVRMPTMIPPGPCPIASSNHLWFGAHFTVE